jgi:hypothetical protein
MDPDKLLELACSLVDTGAERGVTLRILGSLAARSHIGNAGGFLDLLQRVPTHDIDFMGYSSQQKQADRMFIDLGYKPDPSVAFSLEYGVKRLIYHNKEQQIMAEIFLDELKMAHTLDFQGRLELDYPTISLVDLLLSKLQIQQITEKDIKDMIAVLAEHDLGSGDREKIDVNYLLELTGKNWGLYFTALTNLGLVKQWLPRYEVIDISTRQSIEAKLAEMMEQMESSPKSLRWKLRSMVGTRVRWYETVGDVFDVHK